MEIRRSPNDAAVREAPPTVGSIDRRFSGGEQMKKYSKPAARPVSQGTVLRDTV
jgi:hypothetical protein